MKFWYAYPSNWDELARQCKEQAGWRCQECGVTEGTVAVSHRTGVVYTLHLAAAHLDHDIWNPRPRLWAMCPRCHGRYDASRRERARWLALEIHRHRWLLARWRKRQAMRAMLIELQKGVILRHDRTPPFEQTFNETHPFLVSVWTTPVSTGNTFFDRLFDRPYWFEMARCMSEHRASQVAECLAIRYRFVQIARLQHEPHKGSRFIPIRHFPDEETVKRETAQGN